jgi:hypothetical protein
MLKDKMNTMKKETSTQMNKVLKSTEEGLSRLSEEIEKRGAREKTP